MKKILFLIALIPVIISSQTANKIEGIVIDTPCQLEYTRNIGNQNHYNCVFQENDELLFQYSITVQNLFKEMGGLNGSALESFKKQFFESLKDEAVSNHDKVETVYLSNGDKALKTTSSLTYSGHQFVVTTIALLYKRKSFMINLTTNDVDNTSEIKLTKNIKFD